MGVKNKKKVVLNTKIVSYSAARMNSWVEKRVNVTGC